MGKPNGQKEFFNKVEKTEGCWKWKGRKHPTGYGVFDFLGSAWLAHRVSWLFHAGSIEQEKDILHSCDNPECVNPAHLRVGTHAENMRDKLERGRQKRGTQCSNAKLTDDQVAIIKAAGRAVPRLVMAQEFGVNRQAISNILCGRKWKHVQVPQSDN